MSKPTQAVILAGGPANRLLPLTLHRPKAMLIVGGQPLMQFAIESLVDEGIKQIVVVTGAHGDMLQAFFGDGSQFGASIEYVRQPSPIGTRDAIALAAGILGPGSLLVLNGAVFTTPAMVRLLCESEPDCLLVATAGMDYEQWVPQVRGDQLVTIRRESPIQNATRVSTGLAHLGPAMLQLLGETDHTDFEEALGSAVAAGNSIFVVGLEHDWHTVVSPWDLLWANEVALAASPAESLTEGGTSIAPTRIGCGSQIAHPSSIGPYVSVRSNSRIGAHSEIRRSIINNNVVVEGQSVLRGCIVDDGAVIGPGFLCVEESTGDGLRGCIIGEDAVIGAACRAEAGAIIDAGAEVPAGSVIRADGSIIERLGDELRARALS